MNCRNIYTFCTQCETPLNEHSHYPELQTTLIVHKTTLIAHKTTLIFKLLSMSEELLKAKLLRTYSDCAWKPKRQSTLIELETILIEMHNLT